jgi:hypothetical protein
MKKMKRTMILCAALLCAAFALCAGVRAMAQAGNSPPPESPPALYAAGAERNSSGYDTAMVWKIDGSTITPMALTDGTRHLESAASAVIAPRRP